VKIQVEVFWDVTPCSVVAGYHRFFTLKMEAGPLKRWYPITALHGVTIQKNSTCKLASWVVKIAGCSVSPNWFRKVFGSWLQ